MFLKLGSIVKVRDGPFDNWGGAEKIWSARAIFFRDVQIIRLFFFLYTKNKHFFLQQIENKHFFFRFT